MNFAHSKINSLLNRACKLSGNHPESHTNHCKRNMPFCLARRICTIAENDTEKLKNLENLKSNLSKYHYPNSLIKQGFQKALSIPQKDFK